MKARLDQVDYIKFIKSSHKSDKFDQIKFIFQSTWLYQVYEKKAKLKNWIGQIKLLDEVDQIKLINHSSSYKVNLIKLITLGWLD